MSEIISQYSEFLQNTPASWTKVKILDVGQIVSGGTPSRDVPSFWNGGIPWVTPGELTSLPTKEIHETNETISHAGLSGSGANLLPERSLLVTSRATLGARAVNAVPMATNQGFKSLVPYNKKLTDYLYHLVDKIKPEMVRRACGTTFLEISGSEFGDIDLPVPNTDVAVKIAEILDTLDAAIRGTEAVVAKLKAMKQGLLHDLLTRGIDANGDLRPTQSEAPHLYKQTPLGWLPKEWDVIELGSLTRELTQGWSPDCPSEAALAHEWGILKTTAVVWSGYQEHENKRLPEGMRPRPLLQVEVDDILITRAGPSSRVAVVAHVPDTRDKLMISDKLYRLRVTSAHNPSFVATALSSMAVQREISKAISGMAESQTNISQAALKPLLVPIPSRREQDEIMLGLQAQSQKLRDEEDLLEKLRLQKIGLMDDLLTGRISVTPLL